MQWGVMCSFFNTPKVNFAKDYKKQLEICNRLCAKASAKETS